MNSPGSFCHYAGKRDCFSCGMNQCIPNMLLIPSLPSIRFSPVNIVQFLVQIDRSRLSMTHLAALDKCSTSTCELRSGLAPNLSALLGAALAVRHSEYND